MTDAATVANYTLAFTAIQEKTGLAAAAIWAELGSWNEADVALFVAQLEPVISTAAVTVSRAVDAEFARIVSARPIGVPSDVVSGLRGDVDMLEAYRRPFIQVWTDLSKGVPWEDAVKHGGDMAASMARTDVSLAQGKAADYLTVKRADVVGYRRVINGGACMFCAAASTRIYNGKLRKINLHTNCKCGVAPVTADGRDPAQDANDIYLDRLKSRGPDYWKQSGFVDGNGDPIDPTNLSALREFDETERTRQLGVVLALTR